MKKTNAMRILETAGVPYSSAEYAWDEAHLDAVSAAQKMKFLFFVYRRLRKSV